MPSLGKWRTLPLIAPSVLSLLVWMVVPLTMTLWFSFQRYQLLAPQNRGFNGGINYAYLITDPALSTALFNTILLLGSVLTITVVLGLTMAVLFSQDFSGRSVARILVISPFFVMPTVSALIWKNMLMHPVNGLFAFLGGLVGMAPVDWFGDWPMASIIIIVSWQWVPFALLIFLTALQSVDRQQKEAAYLDGAGSFAVFFHVILPHLKRAIAMVVMIEMIFFLTIFAEIFVTTSGGPGLATTNLAFLIYIKSMLEFDVGVGSAGGVLAIILANIVAVFLIRTVARTLDA
jgi:sorbitol/mannitol transport system permease protein